MFRERKDTEKEAMIASLSSKKKNQVRVYLEGDNENYVEFPDMQDPALEKFLNHQLFERDKKGRRR